MRERKSIKLNFIMNSMLNMSSFLFALLTFPYVSRVLSAEGLGKVVFATSFVSYISILSQLGIPVYGIRACAAVRDDKVKLSRTVQELMIIQLMTTALSYIILFAVLYTVPRLQADRLLYVVVSLNIFFLYIGMEWLYRALEMYTYITARSILFKFIALLALLLLVHRKEDYILYGGISIFASSASSVLNFLHARRYVDFKIAGGYDFRKHLKPVFVFFAMSCATTIYTNLDTVMLGFMTSDLDVGYYSAAVKVKTILVSVVTSLGAVLLPRASYYLQNDMKSEFARIIGKSLHFIVLAATPLTLYFMLFAENGIRFLAGYGYDSAIVPMIVIMPTLLLIGLSNVTGIQVLVPMGRERVVLYSEILGAAVDLVLNLILIPRLASTGAAIGTLLAEMAVLIFQYWSDKKMFQGVAKDIQYVRIGAALMLAAVGSVWVKMLHMDDFPTLMISAVLFFGSYGVCLLLMKEAFVMEYIEKLLQGNRRKHNTIKKDRFQCGGGIMKSKKTLYIRTVAAELVQKKRITLACMIGFAVAFTFFGVQKANKAVTLSVEEQQEVDEYQEKIQSYDTIIEDVKKSLAEADKQVTELQDYVDHSIYMNIDPQNIQVATVQYGIQTGGNVGNIYNSFITYINDGGMREGLAEKYPELQVEYWRDIISCYQSGNTLNVTVIHHNAEQGKQILEAVKKRIGEYTPKVKSLQGDFNLVEMNTSTYVKSDVNVVNGQNNHRNNLKNYIGNRSDYNNKLISNENNKKTYIEKNEPEVLEVQPVNKVVVVVKFLIAGMIFGIMVPCVVSVLRFILSDRLRSAEELSESGLNVIGSCKEGRYTEAELERSGMDVKVLAEANGLNTVFLNRLNNDDISKQTVSDYQKALAKIGIISESGSNVYESADELKAMIAQKSCILVAEAGKTTFGQLKKQKELCQRFKVTILGCIVIE